MASNIDYDAYDKLTDYKHSINSIRMKRVFNKSSHEKPNLVKYYQGIRNHRLSTARHKKLNAMVREKERNKKPPLISGEDGDENICSPNIVVTRQGDLMYTKPTMIHKSDERTLWQDSVTEEIPATKDDPDKDGRLNYIKLLTKLIDLNMPSKIESNRSIEAYTKRLFFLEKRRYDSERDGNCSQLFCNESFWLELQHRFKNRTSDRIINMRQQFVTSLLKLVNFRIKGAEMDVSDIQSEKLYSISKSYLSKIKVAQDQVSDALTNYHYVLSFWPTSTSMTKYMMDNYPQWICDDAMIAENIESMQAWQTCCESLIWKTRQICQVVGISGPCLHNFMVSDFQDIDVEDNFTDGDWSPLSDMKLDESKPPVNIMRLHSQSLKSSAHMDSAYRMSTCERSNEVLTDGDCESKFEIYADISRRRYGFAKVCSTAIDSVRPMLVKFQHLLSITKDENMLPLMLSYADALKKDATRSRCSTPNPVDKIIFSENVSEGSFSSYKTATLDSREYPMIAPSIGSKLSENRFSISALCSPSISSIPSLQYFGNDFSNEVCLAQSEISLDMLPNLSGDTDDSDRHQTVNVKGLLGLRNRVAARLFLPPLLPHYLFLARFPIKIMHCCIRKMIYSTDSQKMEELSVITIKQKILDFKEALQRTMESREFLRNVTYGINFQIYKFHASSTKEFAPKQDVDHSDFMRSSVKEIDDDLSILLRCYINSLKELLKKWSQPLYSSKFGQGGPRKLLEEEWHFVKTHCHSIKQEEEIVASSFCNLAEFLFDLLLTKIESNHKLNLEYDVSPTEYQSVYNIEEDTFVPTNRDNRRMSKSCHTYKNRCKLIESQLKQATDFAKRLRADLEISFQLELNINYSMNDFLHYLSRTKHKMVDLCSPDDIAIRDSQSDLTLIIPEESYCHLNELLHPLVTGFSLQPNDECIVPSPHTSSTSQTHRLSLSREYILIINKKTKMNWPGDKIRFFYPLDMGNLKQRIESSNIVFIARRPDELTQQLSHLYHCQIILDPIKTIYFKDVVQSCSDGQGEACHYNSKRTLNALKSKSIEVGNTLQMFFIDDERELFRDMDSSIALNRIQEDTLKNSIKNSYSITFEFYRDLIKLCTGDPFKKTLKNSILSLLEKWFQFSKLFEPSEKGTVPRWANDGLNFLLQLCQSRVVINMTTIEWQDFKKSIDNFVEFIVGQGSRPCSQASGKSSTTSSKVVTSRSWLTIPKPDIIRGDEIKINNVNKIGNWETDYDKSRTLRSAFSEPNRTFQGPEDMALFVDHLTNCVNSSKYEEALDNFDEVTFSKDVPLFVDFVPDSHSTHKSTDGSSIEDNKGRKRMQLKQKIERLEKQLDTKRQQNKLIGFVRDSNIDMASSLYVKKAPFQWIKKGLIGQGHSGTVYKVCNLESMEIMAMKEIVINEPFCQDRIESDLLCKLKFPSLLKYFGVDISLSHVRIFTEYCDSGSLSQVSILDIPEIIVRQWTKQVLDAVVYLHDHKIVHRDIKPDNIFLINSEDGKICYAKLGDFGVAKCLNNDDESLKDVQGTMMYMAPEVVVVDSVENVSKMGYNHKVDIWSLGCVVLYMVNGKNPWPDLEQMSIYYNLGIKKQPHVPGEQSHARMTKEARDFIVRCITVNPLDRPEAIELKNFHFVILSDP